MASDHVWLMNWIPIRSPPLLYPTDIVIAHIPRKFLKIEYRTSTAAKFSAIRSPERRIYVNS